MNPIAFLAGLAVGAALAGVILTFLLCAAIEYRKHPEWWDDNEDINIDID